MWSNPFKNGPNLSSSKLERVGRMPHTPFLRVGLLTLIHALARDPRVDALNGCTIAAVFQIKRGFRSRGTATRKNLAGSSTGLWKWCEDEANPRDLRFSASCPSAALLSCDIFPSACPAEFPKGCAAGVRGSGLCG